MFRKLIRKYFQSDALILMYHRVYEPHTDVWDLSVSPQNFEAHLQVLQKRFSTIPLSELIDRVNRKKIKRRTVALTFDDGYLDNYQIAKPLLEKYRTPATFFICTGNINTLNQFWWDELEQIFLNLRSIPSQLPIGMLSDLSIEDRKLETEMSLDLSVKHKQWRAFVTPPPSNRAKVFLDVWGKLWPMRYAAQQEIMGKLRIWANQSTESLHGNMCINLSQLKDLTNHALIEIGAHSMTHPALGTHDLDFQRSEIKHSQEWLAAVLKKKINLFAFPFGSYTPDSLNIVKELGFQGSVITEQKVVKSSSNPFSLGRFVVPNWTGQQFEVFLNSQLSSK